MGIHSISQGDSQLQGNSKIVNPVKLICHLNHFPMLQAILECLKAVAVLKSILHVGDRLQPVLQGMPSKYYLIFAFTTIKRQYRLHTYLRRRPTGISVREPLPGVWQGTAVGVCKEPVECLQGSL